MNIFLIIMVKIEGKFFYLVFYFFYQEFLGFILFFSINYIFLFFVLLIKSGLGPFFIWFLIFLSELEGESFSFFVLDIKLLYLPLLEGLKIYYLFFFLGLILLWLFYFYITDYKFLIFFNSLESFNLSLLIERSLDFWIIFLMYIFYFCFILRSENKYDNLEQVLFFGGWPMNLVFLIKIYFFLFFFNSLSFFFIFIIMFFSRLSQFFYLWNYFFKTIEKKQGFFFDFFFVFYILMLVL